MTQPIRRFQAGACSASIFVNEIQEGLLSRRFHSVSLQRFYRYKTGGFSYTASLKKDDLPNAITVLEQAKTFLEGGEVQRELGGDGEPHVAASKPKTI